MAPEIDTVIKFQDMVTNYERAEAAFAIEQGLRAIERYRIPTCIEHGFTLSRCRKLGLYHANGKTKHGCVKGFP